MPRTSETGESLPNLFRQLGTDGLGVAEAELALARAEMVEVLRGYLIGIALAAAVFAVTLTALLVLAQAGAIALTPYVANPAVAYLSVGLGVAAMAIILALFASNWLTRRHRPIGMIFKWLLGEDNSK